MIRKNLDLLIVPALFALRLCWITPLAEWETVVWAASFLMWADTIRMRYNREWR